MTYVIFFGLLFLLVLGGLWLVCRAPKSWGGADPYP